MFPLRSNPLPSRRTSRATSASSRRRAGDSSTGTAAAGETVVRAEDASRGTRCRGHCEGIPMKRPSSKRQAVNTFRFCALFLFLAIDPPHGCAISRERGRPQKASGTRALFPAFHQYFKRAPCILGFEQFSFSSGAAARPTAATMAATQFLGTLPLEGRSLSVLTTVS